MPTRDQTGPAALPTSHTSGTVGSLLGKMQPGR